MGSSNPNEAVRRPRLYDAVRLKWVKATPEEHVRQHWLKWMIHYSQYPKELLVVEKKIKELPHLFGKPVPDRRVDILCYGKDVHPVHPLYPLLMVECKDEPIKPAAVDQVIGYNTHVKAFFIAVVNLEEVRFGLLNESKKKYEFCSVFPSFMELKQWAKPSFAIS